MTNDGLWNMVVSLVEVSNMWIKSWTNVVYAMNHWGFAFHEFNDGIWCDNNRRIFNGNNGDILTTNMFLLGIMFLFQGLCFNKDGEFRNSQWWSSWWYVFSQWLLDFSVAQHVETTNQFYYFSSIFKQGLETGIAMTWDAADLRKKLADGMMPEFRKICETDLWALEQSFGDALDPFRFCWLHHFWLRKTWYCNCSLVIEAAHFQSTNPIWYIYIYIIDIWLS